MKFGRSLLCAGALLAAGATQASADGMIGPRIGSIKDGAPRIASGGCGGRFQGAYAGFNLGYTEHRSKWEELYTDYSDYQDLPLKKNSGALSGGAQIGYNWQHCSNWLFGVEADINKTNAGHYTDPYYSVDGPGFGHITIRDRLSAYATLRGRLGFVLGDRTLIYGTAGLAFGDIKHEVRDIGRWDGTDPINHTHNGWKRGWVAGAGFETALTRMVSLKGEALWMGFGSDTHFSRDNPVPPAPIDPYLFRHGEKNFTARVGLNFKLGDMPRYHEPVSEPPPPPKASAVQKAPEAPCSSKNPAKCKPLK